jgi:hypothetical protein
VVLCIFIVFDIGYSLPLIVSICPTGSPSLLTTGQELACAEAMHASAIVKTPLRLIGILSIMLRCELGSRSALEIARLEDASCQLCLLRNCAEYIPGMCIVVDQVVY